MSKLSTPISALAARARLRSEAGDVRVWPIIAWAIIITGYILFPQDVNHFISYLLHAVFSDLHKSFGSHSTTSSTTTAVRAVKEVRK